MRRSRWCAAVAAIGCIGCSAASEVAPVATTAPTSTTTTLVSSTTTIPAPPDTPYGLVDRVRVWVSHEAESVLDLTADMSALRPNEVDLWTMYGTCSMAEVADVDALQIVVADDDASVTIEGISTPGGVSGAASLRAAVPGRLIVGDIVVEALSTTAGVFTGVTTDGLPVNGGYDCRDATVGSTGPVAISVRISTAAGDTRRAGSWSRADHCPGVSGVADFDGQLGHTGGLGRVTIDAGEGIISPDRGVDARVDVDIVGQIFTAENATVFVAADGRTGAAIGTMADGTRIDLAWSCDAINR